ncbi:MAG TPA: hypothetical protein VE053_00205 [Allosphingosinicella sp.]|nr:hypothetical protein [Allosphingosinicella sp.]
MLKRIGLLSAVALSLAVGALPAGAQDGPIAYNTYFYSDASMTTQVGVLRPRCINGDLTYRLTGSQSAYSQSEEAYICGPDGPEPL